MATRRCTIPTGNATRGHRLWNRVSTGSATHWGERAAAPIHTQILEAMRPVTGGRALDIGCGDGAYFATLHQLVGDTGEIHGIDYSEAMIARARARIAEPNPPATHIELADFTTAALQTDHYDLAIAVFGFSAMADVRAALTNAHRALRPGGQLFVIDLRLHPTGPAAALIQLARLTYRHLAGWSGVDVRDTATSIFGRTEPTSAADRTWPPVTVFTATKTNP